MARYAVYIVTNKRNGTVYIGVTGDLVRRTWQHRTGAVPGFTKRYGLKRLVWYELHDSIEAAIQREKTMKSWPRQWKRNVIEERNPRWRDLWNEITR